MPLKKSVGNMYTWVTHTWAPIRGRCEHDCVYCYMKRWGPQPWLNLIRDELRADLGSGNTIFVGHTTDMFAEDVPCNWIFDVLKACLDYPENTYLFQSKNPRRFKDVLHKMPEQSILATTIETNRHMLHISKAPPAADRAAALGRLPPMFKKSVTIEPIMDFDLDPMVELIKQSGASFVSIGADSKGHDLLEPSPEKAMELIDRLTFVDIKIKDNFHRLMKPKEKK